MSDLIDRQSAIDAIQAAYIYTDGGEDKNAVWTNVGLTNALHIMQDLPSAQPEIVRCKECKHYVAHSLFGRSQGWCERLCDEFDKSLARETEPDDYCSKAEPYKGEQE